jgi:hypothetical protein
MVLNLLFLSNGMIRLLSILLLITMSPLAADELPAPVQPKKGRCEVIWNAMASLKVIGPTARYIGASPLIRQVDANRTRGNIQQATFERDVAGIDFKEARAAIDSWFEAYEAYPKRLHELEKARELYTDYSKKLIAA